MSQKFFGKYRGKVISNVDPERRGRLRVEVPQVLGTGTLSWALPSVPYAGVGFGFFAVPPVATNVWVEFEGGSPDLPIWSGCFWDREAAPLEAASPSTVVLKTPNITLKLAQAGFTLDVLAPGAAPMKISLTSTGIEIVNGKNSVKLNPMAVTINDGALEVI